VSTLVFRRLLATEVVSLGPVSAEVSISWDQLDPGLG
jgi:hypothetical protein